MPINVNSEAIARKHGLEGEDLSLFHQFLNINSNYLPILIALSKTEHYSPERMALRQKLEQLKTEERELKRKMPQQVHRALDEYFRAKIESMKA